MAKWNKEKCFIKASKFKTKKEFRQKFPGAYLHAIRRNFLEEICAHMIKLGNRFNRCVYVYVFPDKHAYIGLTYNIKKRDNQHRRKIDSQVFKHIQKTGLKPELKQISDYINKDLAASLEEKTINDYKKNKFIILNKAKSGAMGGSITIWDIEKCRPYAAKCKTLKEFKKKFPKPFHASCQNKWIQEICSHMIIKKRNYWTKDLIYQKALKYKNRKEFKLHYPGAYLKACRKGWIKEICSHMQQFTKPKGYWTKDKCRECANKCQTRTDFARKFKSAYLYSRINNWLDDFFPKPVKEC